MKEKDDSFENPPTGMNESDPDFHVPDEDF